MRVPFERKPFKFIISRKDGEVYLVRWNLVQCPWFTIKLHKILKSDDACLHDHPWAFVSIILWGGYVEHSEVEKKVKRHVDGYGGIKVTQILKVKRSKIYHPFNILRRKASFRHRLEIHQTAWTLVITSRRVRQWGFWTKRGWIEWFKYDQGSNQCE